MLKTTKLIGTSFGIVASVAGLSAFAFWQAPDTQASASVPASVVALTTTTAAPEVATATTALKASPVKRKPVTTTSTSTTLATIPQKLVDRIPGPDFAPEQGGMSDEENRTTTTLNQVATDYVDER